MSRQSIYLSDGHSADQFKNEIKSIDKSMGGLLSQAVDEVLRAGLSYPSELPTAWWVILVVKSGNSGNMVESVNP